MLKDICAWGLWHYHTHNGSIGWAVWLLRHKCGADDFNDLIGSF